MQSDGVPPDRILVLDSSTLRSLVEIASLGRLNDEYLRGLIAQSGCVAISLSSFSPDAGKASSSS
jgi:hypothetical protein